MNLPDYSMSQHSLDPYVAKNLSHSTKSVPMMESITPRWFLDILPWVSVEAGVYSVNKLKKQADTMTSAHAKEKDIDLYLSPLDEYNLPQTYPEYEENPTEYILNLVQTVLRVNTNVTDIFNHPIDQLKEQMRLTIEAMKERQEYEMINNENFGLCHNICKSMKVSPRRSSPTPDDLDTLLSKVWKKPAFFLAHPKTIAAFGRECTRRGVPPVIINLYGSPFMTWRGVPIIPSDKLLISDQNTSNILLMRVGEKEQGVVGLHQPGIPDEINIPSLSVKWGGIDHMGISSYIMSLYFSVAALANDAIGMLENVGVENYYDYQ